MSKGSKRRVENFKEIQSNWDEISWETRGTRIARETRAKSNKLSKEERARLLEEGLKIVYSKIDQ